MEILEIAREGLYFVEFTWDMGNRINNFFSLVFFRMHIMWLVIFYALEFVMHTLVLRLHDGVATCQDG